MDMDIAKIMGQLSDVVGAPDDVSYSVPYFLPTCLPNLNIAISGRADGGWPGGRLITISGPESSGKTALATEAVVQGQRLGGFGLLIDHEHAFIHEHARRLGVNYDAFYPKRPNTAEEGFDIAYHTMRIVRATEIGIRLPEDTKQNPRASFEALLKGISGKDIRTFKPIVGIMDSIASMIPESQDIRYVDQNMKTKNMELAAMLSIELKRLVRDANLTGTTWFLLNQLRTNPGVMFGDNSAEPGGHAPKFYASVQVRLRRVNKLYAEWGDSKSAPIGDIVEFYTRKNKTHRPFQKTQYVFRTVDPVGLDPVLTMILLGKEAGILGAVGGKTIEFGGKKRWPISEAERELRADPKALAEFTDFIMKSVNPVSEQAPADDDDDDDAPASAGGIKQFDLGDL